LVSLSGRRCALVRDAALAESVESTMTTKHGTLDELA
jgi:hypothetical protein